MFDGSHLPVEENLNWLKTLLEKAHAKGISVEASWYYGVKKTVSSGRNWLQSKTLAKWLKPESTSWQLVSVTSIYLPSKL